MQFTYLSILTSQVVNSIRDNTFPPGRKRYCLTGGRKHINISRGQRLKYAFCVSPAALVFHPLRYISWRDRIGSSAFLSVSPDTHSLYLRPRTFLTMSRQFAVCNFALPPTFHIPTPLVTRLYATSASHSVFQLTPEPRRGCFCQK
jgi:hypothetical protein